MKKMLEPMPYTFSVKPRLQTKAPQFSMSPFLELNDEAELAGLGQL